jgi:hypothetical protein
VAPKTLEKSSSPVSLKHYLFFILAVLLMMHWFALPKITHISKTDSDNVRYEALSLPTDIHIRNEGGGGHSYHLTIQYSKGQQTLYHLHIQNCLKRVIVNGFPFSFPLNKACNFATGMVLDLKRQLLEGTNHLRIDTQAPGLAIGPVIFSGALTLSDILGCLLLSGICIAMTHFLRQQTGSVVAGILLSSALLLYAYVMTHTTFMWKKYDLPQHLEYITYISEHWRWPTTYHGFLTYHPPLYYTLQAIWLAIINWLGSFSAIEALRSFSMACFMGSSLFNIMTLRKLIKHNLAFHLSVAFLVFYPGAVITAARIDSNLLFYTFFSGSLYFLTCWMHTTRTRDMAWAIAMCGLGIASRTNAILLLPLFGLATLYMWRRHGHHIMLDHLRSVAIWCGILVMLLSALVNFGRPAYDNLTTQHDREYLVGNADYLASIAGGLRISNRWHHYLTFNIKEYFDPPYFNVWNNSGGRLFFWDSVLKSSMYGEFSYPNPIIAYYLNWMLLCLVLYIPFSVLCETRRLRQQPEWLMLFLTFLIPVLGLAANRILHPIACSQDFRYVYPVIAALCGLVGFSIQQHLLHRRHLFAMAGTVLIICFVTLSLMFFANMH